MKDAWPEEAAVRRKVKATARLCSSVGVAQIAAAAEPKSAVQTRLMPNNVLALLSDPSDTHLLDDKLFTK
eukprot:2864798-Amphidinium_carterae.2